MRRSLLLVALVCAYRAHAINYVFDEFLFSKDSWSSWKLENPLEDFNPTDLLPRTKNAYPRFDSSEFNSLDGPHGRIRVAKRATSTGSPDVEAIDDENMVEHAAQASQCMTCHVLATVVWSRLTDDILSGKDVTEEVVGAHLEEACEKEVVDAMLRKYTILKMSGGSSGGGGGGQASLTFIVVRERRDGSLGASATEAEEATVMVACKKLLLESGGELVTELMQQLSNFRRESIRLLAKYDRDGGNPPEEPPVPPVSGKAATGSGSGSSGRLPRLGGGAAGAAADDDEDDEYEDPDDLDEDGEARPGAGKKVARGPTAQQQPQGPWVIRGLVIKAQPNEPECADLNPKCTDWAASGECTRNPAYMVGTATHKGQCRKACGECQPEEALLKSSPALAGEVEKLSAALLLALRNLGCGASGACLTGVSGMAMNTGLLKQQLPQSQQQLHTQQQQSQSVSELLPGMKQFPGGFVLNRPWWGVPTIQEVQHEAQRKAPPASEASASAAPDDSAATPGSSGSSSTAPSHAEVDRVLGPALSGKLLSIPDNFFTYEYLYKNHTRHYHVEADGSLTEDWLLGKFSRESVSLISSATGEAAGLEDLDLLPGSTLWEALKTHNWPYVKQVYAGGDECVLAGGRRVVRRVEARLACSPDSGTYMLVREPDFCTYTFVVFVPELCALDYYRPRPKAQGVVLGAQQGARTGAGRQQQGDEDLEDLTNI